MAEHRKAGDAPQSAAGERDEGRGESVLQGGFSAGTLFWGFVARAPRLAAVAHRNVYHTLTCRNPHYSTRRP